MGILEFYAFKVIQKLIGAATDLIEDSENTLDDQYLLPPLKHFEDILDSYMKTGGKEQDNNPLPDPNEGEV